MRGLAAAPLYAYYWSVNSQSKHKEAAFRLAAFLASKPGDWLKNVNFIPPKVGWNELPEAKEFPLYSVWAAEMLKGNFLPVVPRPGGDRQHHEERDRGLRPQRHRAQGRARPGRAADRPGLAVLGE